MAANSDVQEIVSRYFHDLNALVDTFNFTRPGRERSLGLDAVHIVAEGIVDRSAKNQGSASGNPWPPNRADYTAAKLAKYSVSLIGFRTGQMISIPSLLGQVDIRPREIEIRYGTGRPPTRSMTGHIEPADMKVTDTQKAEWFTNKKGDFYEVDEKIADKVREHFVAELERFIDELNALS